MSVCLIIIGRLGSKVKGYGVNVQETKSHIYNVYMEHINKGTAL
jgi:hypothetical protein